jgi:hypothetical protein
MYLQPPSLAVGSNKTKKTQEQTMKSQLIRNTLKVGFIGLICLICLAGSNASAQSGYPFGRGGQINLNSGIGITFGGGRVGVNFGGGYYPYQNYRHPYSNPGYYRPHYPVPHYPVPRYPVPLYQTPYYRTPNLQPHYYSPQPSSRSIENSWSSRQKQERLDQENERHQREIKRILTDR